MHAMQGFSHFTNDPINSLQINCLDNGKKKTQSKIICPLKFFDCPNRVAPYMYCPIQPIFVFFHVVVALHAHYWRKFICMNWNIWLDKPYKLQQNLLHQLPSISYLETKESLSLFGGQWWELCNWHWKWKKSVKLLKRKRVVVNYELKSNDFAHLRI